LRADSAFVRYLRSHRNTCDSGCVLHSPTWIYQEQMTTQFSPPCCIAFFWLGFIQALQEKE
jgi:hypothetical protein